MIVYLDTSALLKRVVIEDESEALNDYLTALAEAEQPATLVTSALARVEIARRVWRAAEDAAAVVVAVDDALSGVDTVPLDQCVDDASSLETRYLRALDALHIAASKIINASVFVTYDKQQAHSARTEQLTVVMPNRLSPAESAQPVHDD
ncbi:MAG: type II toxin-antitoxin system VapC family toxin [Jiangellaceae bacterium]